MLLIQVDPKQKPREAPKNEGLWGQGRDEQVAVTRMMSHICACFVSSSIKEEPEVQERSLVVV